MEICGGEEKVIIEGVWGSEGWKVIFTFDSKIFKFKVE